jgi:hypothetical protein
MNSLKGLGFCVLFAAAVFGMHQLAHTALLLVATVAVVVVSTATYLASRRRYHRDRRIASG